MAPTNNPQPQYPPSWKPFTKGLCEGCWSGCCTLPVEARHHDIVRLGLATAEEIEWSAEAVAQKLIKRRLVQYYDDREQMFVLDQVAGRDCVFLDPVARTCTVYERRPDTCRNFPKIGPRPGFCPHRPK